jgi:hypothetical protein
MEQGWNKDGTRMEQGWKDGFNSEQDVNTMDRFDSRICAVVQTASDEHMLGAFVSKAHPADWSFQCLL